MIINRKKATIHGFEGVDFIPGINIVDDEIGKKIVKLGAFKEQVKLGFMEIVEDAKEGSSASASSLTELLASKNTRDAKKIVVESFDINELRDALDSEERAGVQKAIQAQIDVLEEGRDKEKDED